MYLLMLFVFGSLLYGTMTTVSLINENNPDSDLFPNPKEYKRKNFRDSGDIKEMHRIIERLNKRVSTLEKKQSIHDSVKFLTYKDRKKILVTGGAGFVGSHLVDELMLQGHEVTVIDNFFTGRKRNIEHWLGHPNFEMIIHDVITPIRLEVDEIYHLASPASPKHYMDNPVKTLKTNTIGTVNMLSLAKMVKAKFLLASTSEVYGDPDVHPQKEDYWGHVNPIGPRACYDEGKRVAETITYAFNKQDKVNVRVARIFNTFGPRMHMNDGRVVSNFILQALQNEAITVYGDGSQTRSFQYVSDLVAGLISLMNRNFSLPVNLGNPDEHTILNFAKIIKSLVGNSSSEIIFKAAVEDDPHRRRPDINRAKTELKWFPKVSMKEGLLKTINYFQDDLTRQARNQRRIKKSNLVFS